MSRSQVNRTVAIHAFLVCMSSIMILPFVWMFLTSCKTVAEATSINPFVIFPEKPQWENYSYIFINMNMMRLYLNTMLSMAFRIVCAVVFSAMASYAFARLSFPGKNFFFSLVLFQMMVPTQIFIIPQYLMIDALHMRNTIFALVFPGLVSAFGTFLLRQFFLGLPKELEEAAKIDGYNIGQTFLFIMMPLVKAGLVALAIFTALFGFKDLLWPLIVNTKQEMTTLSAALAKLQGAYAVHYPRLMAAAVIAVIPMLAIYAVFQKQFIKGIATSGGKL